MTRTASGELQWHGSEIVRTRLGYETAADALDDPRGRTVRCTPHRRTVMLDLRDAGIVFRKVRTRRPGDADRERAALERVATLGIGVPRPLFVARSGARSAIGLSAVGGRPLDAVIADHLRDGRRSDIDRYVAECVVPCVRRLHEAGLCHRDLYWNHLFVHSLAEPPTLIDIERVFAPRLRRARWIAKDLAALVASWPTGDDADVAARLVDAYGDGGPTPSRVAARAARIRAHVPRFG